MSRDGRGPIGLYEDRSEQRVGLVAGDELGGEEGLPERQVAGVDRDDGGVGMGPVAEHERHASPMWACAVRARWRPSAIASPWRFVTDPLVTPTSRPPPWPPSRIWAGMLSSEAPMLGPRAVEVRATAERTPGVARASASAPDTSANSCAVSPSVRR